jgi:hypothetical protein
MGVSAPTLRPRVLTRRAFMLSPFGISNLCQPVKSLLRPPPCALLWVRKSFPSISRRPARRSVRQSSRRSRPAVRRSVRCHLRRFTGRCAVAINRTMLSGYFWRRRGVAADGAGLISVMSWVCFWNRTDSCRCLDREGGLWTEWLRFGQQRAEIARCKTLVLEGVLVCWPTDGVNGLVIYYP